MVAESDELHIKILGPQGNQTQKVRTGFVGLKDCTYEIYSDFKMESDTEFDEQDYSELEEFQVSAKILY